MNFDLMTGTLAAMAAEEQLFAPLAEILAGLERPDVKGPVFNLTIAEGEPARHPRNALEVYSGPIPGDDPCIFTDLEGELQLVFPGKASLTIERGGSSARLIIAPNSRNAVGQTCGLMAIQAALDSCGQSMMHSAALSIPGTDEALLISAVSGAGKTTASLALASQGFGLMTDDTVVLGASEEGVHAWGLPRDPKVHINTARMLPFLEAFQLGNWNDEGEKSITLRELSRRIRVEAPQPVPVRALYQLQRDRGDATRIETLAGTDALASLASDNIRIGKTGLLAMHGRQFAMLATLVTAVPVFRLYVGTDISRLGQEIVAHLGDLPVRRMAGHGR
jgi:hypothetical protein